MISLRDRFIAYTVLLLGAVVALYPLWSIFSLSISETKRIEKSNFNFLGIYFGNYVEAWNRGAFDRALLSSLFVSTSVVLVTLLCSVLAGYALALMKVPFSRTILLFLLLGLVMPYEGIVISLRDDECAKYPKYLLGLNSPADCSFNSVLYTLVKNVFQSSSTSNPRIKHAGWG